MRHNLQFKFKNYHDARGDLGSSLYWNSFQTNHERHLADFCKTPKTSEEQFDLFALKKYSVKNIDLWYDLMDSFQSKIRKKIVLKFFPRLPSSRGYFWIVFCLCVKTNLRTKPSYENALFLQINEGYFRMESLQEVFFKHSYKANPEIAYRQMRRTSVCIVTSQQERLS